MYKPLKIDYKLPEELEDTINSYIHDANFGCGYYDDVYQEEIKVILNWCQRENDRGHQILTAEQITELREYYQYGGIRKVSESNG
ncbi:MAG: hypothetical protein E7302_07980 [Butyrivibrio sp.]|jgi:hypothetical protein|nr:hypothetical protein [Butyrivibrio sp.]